MARKKKIQNKPSAFQQKYSASPLNACWDGFEAKGMKNKGGKSVPNCVKE
jgi:hypothetical protein